MPERVLSAPRRSYAFLRRIGWLRKSECRGPKAVIVSRPSEAMRRRGTHQSKQRDEASRMGLDALRFRLLLPAAAAVAATLLAVSPARAGGYLKLPEPSRSTRALPVTWFTDMPSPDAADPAKVPCTKATGQL